MIKNSFDIILARMRVRQWARTSGLGIQDQACIALATSSLAHALKLGETSEGRIDIYCSDERDRPGIQVVCTVVNDAKYDPVSKAFADTRWMVDDLTIEALPSNDVEITLVKWAT
jgi:anti-sigma regulatory factor (Ser/Thr protein kinase)